MLNTIRSHAAGLFAKLLLALLVVSFGIWGVADMLRYGGNGTLATVGGQEISRVAFERGLRNARETMRQQMGKNYNPAILRAAHLELRVMEELITAKLLRMEALQLGIIPPDAAVADALRDEKGNFDKQAFNAAVRRSGMGERAFVEDIRQQLAVQTLIRAINTGVPTDRAMLHVLYGAEKEERSADVATLTPALVKDIPAPTEAELKTFYDAHKDAFAAPEYRVVRSISVSKADILKATAMPEDKLDEAVVAFTNKLEDMLAGGDTMKEAAAELKAHYTETTPFDQAGKGTNGEAVSLPEGQAASAFAQADGSESALKAGKDGNYTMQRVDVTQAAAPLPLAKVHERVANAWHRQETYTRLATLAETVANEMKASATPLAVLAKHGLTAEPVAGITHNAKSKLPPALVQDIFTTPVGSSTGIYPTEGGFAIAVVKGKKNMVDTASKALDHDTQFGMFTIDIDHAARDEVLDDYLGYLRSKYRVKVNGPALQAYAETDAQE